jgi:hypothetical protein
MAVSTNASCRYNDRLHGLLREFGKRFSDIEAIYRQAIAAERLHIQTNWCKRLWSKFRSRYTSESDKVLTFISSLDDNQVIDVTTDALGSTLAAHRRFKERHQPKGATAAETPEHQPLPADIVVNPQKNSVNSTTTAITSSLNDQVVQSLSRVRPFDDVEEVRAADAVGTGCAIGFQLHQHTELEEVVVQASSGLPCISAPSKDAEVVSKPFARKLQTKRASRDLELQEIIVKAASLSDVREHAQSASGRPQVNVQDTAGSRLELRTDFGNIQKSAHGLSAAIAMSTVKPKAIAEEQLQFIAMQLTAPCKDVDTEFEGRQNSRCADTHSLAVQATCPPAVKEQAVEAKGVADSNGIASNVAAFVQRDEIDC